MCVGIGAGQPVLYDRLIGRGAGFHDQEPAPVGEEQEYASGIEEGCVSLLAVLSSHPGRALPEGLSGFGVQAEEMALPAHGHAEQ